MKHDFKPLPLLMAMAMALPAMAQTQEVQLGSVEVTGSREPSSVNATVVGAQSIQALRPATSDTASLLRNVPGVSLYGAGGVSSLPSIRGLWEASSGHVMLGYGLSFGQYAFGSLLAITVLVPILGMAPESAALLEVAFTGGHGTAAGLSGTFEELGVGYMTDLALGLATVGLVAGIIVGSLLVRWAIASAGGRSTPRPRPSRSAPPTPSKSTWTTAWASAAACRTWTS